MKIYERNEFWVIVAVIVGFLLSRLWEIGSSIYSFHKKKKAIESELRTNLGLLPQKIDILEKLKNSLENEKLLPTPSVHHQTYLYYLYIGDVGPSLTGLQRENLHIIYESLNVIDNFLDNIFREFIELSATGLISEPFDAYKYMCEDLINRSSIIKELIKGFLENKPTKVTWD